MFVHVVFGSYVPLTFGFMGKIVAISRYAVVKNISGKDSPSTAVQASLGKNLQDILESFKKGTWTVGCLEYLKLGGGFRNIFLYVPPYNLGEDYHFDDMIFLQIGLVQPPGFHGVSLARPSRAHEVTSFAEMGYGGFSFLP